MNSLQIAQSPDQGLFESFYSTVLDLKRAGIITDDQKKSLKEKLIRNDMELLQALTSANDAASLKENLIIYIEHNFLPARQTINQQQQQQQQQPQQLQQQAQHQHPPRAMFSSQGISLEVKTTRNNSINPANAASHNKPELGEFMKYLDELSTNSPQKLTMFDKKQLQKIFKRLQQVVFDQSSPLAPKKFMASPTASNQQLTSGPLLSPKKVPLTFNLEDVLFLNRKYKEIKETYTDVQRVSQLFISDSLAHPRVLKNTKLLLRCLLGVDSFSFISNQTFSPIVVNAHQTGNLPTPNLKKPRSSMTSGDDDRILTPIQIKPTESIVQDYARQQKDPEWVFFDSETNETQIVQKSFFSDQLSDEITALKNGVIEISDLDQNDFPSLYTKFSQPADREPAYRTFIFKFFNIKTETQEVFSLNYHTQESYSSEKSKLLTNNMALPIFQKKALSALGMFLVQSIQQFSNLQESSIQIIDICNYFLNFGKNLLLDIFKRKLESCFHFQVKLRIVENTAEKQSNVENRSRLLSENQLLLEDDNADIVLDCSAFTEDSHERSLFTFFTEIQHYYGKYRQFLEKVNSRVFIYKFFLRSSYQTFLEFSKKGLLKFISHVKTSNMNLDHSKIEVRCLQVQELFKINRRFHAEFQEILDFFNLSSDEQDKINLRLHKEEEVERLKQQRNDQHHLGLSVLHPQLNEEGGEPVLSQRPSNNNNNNNLNDQQSPEILMNEKSQGIAQANNPLLNATINSNMIPNRSFVSSASKSFKPLKSYMKKGNMWFHLRSIPDSSIYVEIRSQSSEKVSIGSIYVNIQDDFHSDSGTNYESFYQLDDILNSLGTNEFNDPRIKLVLKKLYSKVSSISTEEKVQKEYIDTQIELFTASHRERFTSTPVNFGIKHSNSIHASKFQSKSAHNVKSTLNQQKPNQNAPGSIFSQQQQQKSSQQLQQSSTQEGPAVNNNEQQSQQTTVQNNQIASNIAQSSAQQSNPIDEQALGLQQQQLQQQELAATSEVNLTQFLHLSPAVTNIDEWNFNVFELRNTEEKYTTAWNIIRKSEFADSFVIPEEVFANFIKELQNGYDIKNNEFHNFNHGISVMQSCFMLSRCKKAAQVLKKQDIFSVILSGLCHDVGHTGRTNNFEIAVQSKLAIRYSDKSVLEQHHLATTFRILKNQKLDCNILQNLEPQTYFQVRRAMISNILYTDIKQHFKLKQDFETYWKSFDILTNDVEKIPEGEIDLLTGMIIHTADFTAAAKPFPLSRQWSERVNKEFHQQYIEEGKLGVEQTSFMKDLDLLHVMAKAEKGFLNVIVLPLWQSLNDFYSGELQGNLDNLNDSIQKWGELSLQIPTASTLAASSVTPSTVVLQLPPNKKEQQLKDKAQVEEMNSAEEEDEQNEESKINEIERDSSSSSEEEEEDIQEIDQENQANPEEDTEEKTTQSAVAGETTHADEEVQEQQQTEQE